MLHEIEFLEIAKNPVTLVDAVMQAIGTRAMPEHQEQIEVDTNNESNVQLGLEDKTV
jgi:hypothetical protein